MAYCLSDMTRLVSIKLARLALTNRTKSAVTRADIATQHKCGSPISPALENVWAPCFLTNRVEIQALDQLEQMILIGRIAQTNPQPVRFGLTRLCVQNSKFTGQG